ncbi:substrate-binding domain-containing protein [Pararobbsia silviterrae]|uniref:LacI family DNA-binding transcriptional regulator n=1 Tax=Pararobbsia silviterrae TaxID=1792498 RepID=A0A494Y9S9_9BURK|nr:substrate-binding domain-containing protein [Pararobbsia silviterrae]RKP58885.1 LacI family DNA-binding transcriptional regulator [Pararobbsia silviterrae]
MATIKDVAKLAGVGVGTASRTISGKGSVSPEAAARVHAAIAALDFRPSSIGRALSKQSLGMIGLFVPSFRGNFYGTILETTDNELRAVHRHMVVANGSGDGSGDSNGREQALDAIDFLISRDCDGIVVISHELRDDDLIRIRQRMPKLVVLNRASEAMGDACFSVDHRCGGELAAQTLLDNGHRNLAVIAGPATAPDNLERIAGFLSVVAEHGIDPADVKRVESNFTPDGGWRAMKALLDQGRDFTGLFCANDDMAIGALSYLRHTGISVPNDLSIIGYDDVDAAAHTAPTLTSVHIPMEEMTANAVRWLINACYGGELPVTRAFPVSVSERHSVARMRGAKRPVRQA